MYIPEFVCGLVAGCVATIIFFLIWSYRLSRKK
jgi:hypothetical protein